MTRELYNAADALRVALAETDIALPQRVTAALLGVNAALARHAGVGAGKGDSDG